MAFIITNGTAFCHQTRNRAVQIVEDRSMATTFKDAQAAQRLLDRATKKLKGFIIQEDIEEATEMPVETPVNSAAEIQEETDTPAASDQTAAEAAQDIPEEPDEAAADDAAPLPDPEPQPQQIQQMQQQTQPAQQPQQAQPAENAADPVNTVPEALPERSSSRERRSGRNRRRSRSQNRSQQAQAEMVEAYGTAANAGPENSTAYENKPAEATVPQSQPSAQSISQEDIFADEPAVQRTSRDERSQRRQQRGNTQPQDQSGNGNSRRRGAGSQAAHSRTQTQPDPNHRRRMFTTQERNLVYNRTEGHCGICGRFIPLEEYTIDHIIPLSKGGTNDLSNLQPCCSFCNKAKDDSVGDDFYSRIVRIFLYQAKLRYGKKEVKKFKKMIRELEED